VSAVAPLTPIRGARQLSEQVAARLREAVMVGDLRAPAYVRTERVAAELGVSATPVREALMILHSEGTVRWEPRRGFRVEPVTRADVVDLFQVQAQLAGELAARAAHALEPGEVERLRRVQAELEAAVDDAEAVDALNHEIHRTINRAPGARRLAALLNTTVQYVPRHYFGRVQGWAQASAHDHGPVLAALGQADAEAARAAMTAHIAHIGELLVAHLTDRGAFTNAGRE
jgi:DNA-binding GntR family transcriptional regulator